MNRRELRQQLEAQYPFKLELHAHTCPASGCSEVSPRELIRIYADLGFSGVAVTNHFVFQGSAVTGEEYVKAFLHDYEEALEQGQKEGVRVYLGAELRFTQNYNDYLLFGVTEEMLHGIYGLLPYGVENLRRACTLSDSALIQAHPYRDGVVAVDAALLDGVEVYNMHPHHNSRVGLADAYAKRNPHLFVTAGSDFHHSNRGHEGLGAIRTATLPEDGFALASLLKKNDFLLQLCHDRILL